MRFCLKIGILIAATIISTAVQAQTATKGYASPVDIDVYLSGNFGEIRDNHFHSGIDIKTQGATGKVVRAVADGYVSRIGVATGGYGNALYIHHPDGTTTVYGHLERFNEEIAEYVRAAQYRRRSFAVNLYTDEEMFPVKQGDIIAWSGNSGSSGGPHLHFEVREQATQKPINPITRGYTKKVADNIPPTFAKLHHYELEEDGYVASRKTYEIVKDGDVYTIKDGQQVEYGALLATSYFDIELIDYKTGANNTLGIHSLMMTVNGNEVFGYMMDKFSFDETRYANGFVNYGLNKKTRNHVVRTNILPGNKLSIYTRRTDYNKALRYDGQNDPSDHHIEVTATDDNGNSSVLVFEAKFVPDTTVAAERKPSLQLKWDERFVYTNDWLSVSIPARASYMSRLLAVPSRADAPKGAFSGLFTVNEAFLEKGTAATPLHTPMTLRIRPDSIPEALKDKLCIARLPDSGKPLYEGGTLRDGHMEVTTRIFGDFYVTCDTLAPKITATFADNADMREHSVMKIGISDDLSGIAKWEVTVDGQWTLFDHDPKTSSLTHHFKYARYEKGKAHTMVVTAEDGRGNKSTLTRKFIY